MLPSIFGENLFDEFFDDNFGMFPVWNDRNPLYGTDIVYGTLLVKISKGNVSGCLVDIDRCDRCRYFLDQGKSVFGIFFIGPVDKFF